MCIRDRNGTQSKLKGKSIQKIKIKSLLHRSKTAEVIYMAEDKWKRMGKDIARMESIGYKIGRSCQNEMDNAWRKHNRNKRNEETKRYNEKV